MKGAFSLNPEAFPDSIPVISLPDVLLLPGGQLPINIFESRYINLVNDALATPHRLVGLVLQRKNCDKSSGKEALYNVGCAGRITSFTETNSTQYIITLTGVCRFHVKGEIATTRKYRRIIPDWNAFPNDHTIDINVPINRDRLMTALNTYTQVMNLSFDTEYLEEVPNFNLVTFFSMNLPFKAVDRQALLEAKDIPARAEALTTLLEIEQRKLSDNSDIQH